MAWATKFFKSTEPGVDCRDGTPYPIEWEDRWTKLFGQADVLREAHGFPLKVLSCYRTKAYNTRIGGAVNSYHMKGQAVDLQVMGKEAIEERTLQLWEQLKALINAGSLPHIKGAGRYPTFIHIDTRESPKVIYFVGTRRNS